MTRTSSGPTGVSWSGRGIRSCAQETFTGHRRCLWNIHRMPWYWISCCRTETVWISAGKSGHTLLFLTALDEKSEIIEGLLAGGNDYITKPYDVDEFVARIKAQLRLARMNRRDAMEERMLVRDTLSLDLIAQRAYLDGKDMLLTQKEYSLLLLLARSQEETLSSEYLYETVWNMPMTADNRTLKKHISTVRKKMEEGNCRYTITAVYGKGYTFEKA